MGLSREQAYEILELPVGKLKHSAFVLKASKEVNFLVRSSSVSIFAFSCILTTCLLVSFKEFCDPTNSKQRNLNPCQTLRPSHCVLKFFREPRECRRIVFVFFICYCCSISDYSCGVDCTLLYVCRISLLLAYMLDEDRTV